MSWRVAVLIMAFAATTYSWGTARGQDMTLLEHHHQENSHEPKSDAKKGCDEVYDFPRIHGTDPRCSITKHVTISKNDYYEHAACDGKKISQDQCIKCIGITYEFTIMECTFIHGAQVKFASCRFHDDNYTSVRTRKSDDPLLVQVRQTVQRD